jgi:AcrR family transcriptional regulator
VAPYVYDENGRRVAAPSKGQRREQSILDEAEKQLRDNGYEAMTVETIANAAGITRAGLYFYFRSRNDVLAALVQRATTELTSAVVTSDAAPGTSAATAITSALARTEDLWRRHGAVMRAAIELSPTVPVIATLWNDARTTVRDAVSAITSRTGTGPDARPAPPVDDDAGPTGRPALVRALVAMTEQAYLDGFTHGTPLEEVTTTATTIWHRTLQLT